VSYLPSSFYKSLREKGIYKLSYSEPPPKEKKRIPPKLIIFGVIILLSLIFLLGFTQEKKIEEKAKEISKKYHIQNETLIKQNKDKILLLDKLQQEEKELFKELVKNKDSPNVEDYVKRIRELELQIIKLKKELNLNYDKNLEILNELEAYQSIKKNYKTKGFEDFEVKHVNIKHLDKQEKEKKLKELLQKINISKVKQE
jgi:hypothetical protein